MKRETGVYLNTTTAGESVKAFVPNPLPPQPALELTDELGQLLQMAVVKLSQLKIASNLVPSADFFNYAFVRKEAVLSSQIEGIQATLADLLNFEAEAEKPSLDVQEVCNYLDALNLARKHLKDSKGLPLSLRLIKEMHEKLMKGVRGAAKKPGEFRDSQNWIGGRKPSSAHFVPPPPFEMKKCMESLEEYLHKNTQEHPLLKIGLIHVQFETIHPFLDGNGRLGRLLIALLLETWGFLDARLLYLSLYFKRNQQEYYRCLDSVRSDGDWEGWIQFFLEGICETSDEAIKTSQELFSRFEKDRKKILSLPKIVIPAVRLFEELPNHPIVNVNHVIELLKVTKPTAIKSINVLVDAGVLEETTGGQRNRIFSYKKYLDILKE